MFSSLRPSLLYLLPVTILFTILLLANIYPSSFSSLISSQFIPNIITKPDSNMGGGPGNYRTVAYFVNWAIYGRKHRPQDLPADKLTHILYAFANVRPDSGEVYLTDTWADTDIHWEGDSWNDTGTNLYGCLKQLNLLKRKNRNLKVLLSVGGWTYSSNFRQPASTPQGRAAFAHSCVELIRNLGFDGIDIDWEYPQSAGEAADFVALLQAVREAMDAYSRTLPRPYHFELTVACPAGPQNFQKLNIPAMDRLLDFWNLMAYDYAGSWDQIAGHQANIFPSAQNPRSTPFSTTAALNYYTSHGVAPDKIVLGMPLYGRAFQNTDGPGYSYSGIGEGTWENGVHDYKKLPLPGSEERIDRAAGASYCYHPGTRTMVSYDTVEMARLKTRFVRDWALGGAMWWESSADKEGPESLIANVVGGLGGPQGLDHTKNCVDYPHTKYDNLRAGFPNN
ncbi:family 18 glycosyl hydrolase [Xylariaceae sp. FL0662B]|nr:family 18 glycosyl hydrolase [Xylariaceae sp. FL0662B]